MRRIAGTTLVAFLVVWAPVFGQGPIISGDLSIGVPPRPCDIPMLARQIAVNLELPAGIEHMPAGCAQQPPAAQSQAITGLTLNDAIAALAELDRRYRWTLAAGMIVVRPATAWDDPEHFLHTTLPGFRLDAGHVGNALNAVQSALGPGRYDSLNRDMRTAEGNRRFSVMLGPTSVFAALSEIARTHGSLIWEVGYCQGRTSRQTAIIRMRTLDGTNISSHAVVGSVASSCLAD